MAAHAASLAFLESAIKDSDAHLLPVQQDAVSDSLNRAVNGSPRKLVTVRKVQEVTVVRDNPGQGWLHAKIDPGSHVLVRIRDKNPLRVNSMVVFFDVDSFIPETKSDKFGKKADLRRHVNTTSFNGQNGYQVAAWSINTTARKYSSQGFICRLEDVVDIQRQYAEDQAQAKRSGIYGEALYQHLKNIDYAGVIGVEKWERSQKPSLNPPVPGFINGITTDMLRLEDLEHTLFSKKYRNPKRYTYQEAVKVDGSFMTAYFVLNESPFFAHLPNVDECSEYYRTHAKFHNGRFGVCSRNRDLCKNTSSPDVQHFFNTALRCGLNWKLSRYGKSVAVQGQLVGPNQAQNPYGFANGAAHVFYVDAVFDLESQDYWNPREVKKFADDLKLPHVQVRGYRTLPSLASDHAGLQARADSLGPREGLVFRRLSNPARAFKVLNANWPEVRARRGGVLPPPRAATKPGGSDQAKTTKPTASTPRPRPASPAEGDPEFGGFLGFVQEITEAEALTVAADREQRWFVDRRAASAAPLRWWRFRAIDLINWLERRDGCAHQKGWGYPFEGKLGPVVEGEDLILLDE